MTGTTTRIDMAALKLINDRNIFNGFRRPGETNVVGPQKIIRAENFDLTGTISYEKGTFAFFSGSQPDKYSKVLKVGGTIAGYKVIEIGHNSAKLEAGGQQFEMKVGMRMKRENLGPWSMTVSPDGSMYVSGDNRGDRSSPDFGGRSRNNNNQDNGGGPGGRRQRGFGGGNGNGPNSSTETTTSPPVTSATKQLSEAEMQAVRQKLIQDREKETK
jgi:hypothetical protein